MEQNIIGSAIRVAQFASLFAVKKKLLSKWCKNINNCMVEPTTLSLV